MRCIVLLYFALFSAAALAAAPDKDPVYDAAQKAYQREMRKKSPSDRAAGVATLAEFANPDAAELLLKRWQIDTAPEVRIAVRKALRKIAEEPGVQAFLLGEVQKTRKKSGADEHLCDLIRILASIKSEDCQKQVVGAIDDYLSSPKTNWLAVMQTIDDLGTQGDEDAEQAVETFAKAKAFEAKFGYRRCIVQAMTHIKLPAAIGFLIDRLERAEGLIELDIVQHLTRVTGQNFRRNHDEWKAWWAENARSFKFPTTETASSEPLDLGEPTYYRIPICAKRVVFVLDTSRSMYGPPFEAAQQALIKAVQALSDSVAVDVVMFDIKPFPVKPRLVPATAEVKKEIQNAVQVRILGLGTSSNAALQLAFNLEPEAIYFLSDGQPTDGAPAQIVESITAMNRTRRISIHTIGVVTIRGGGFGLTQFMQPLADRNYGTFQLVE